MREARPDLSLSIRGALSQWDLRPFWTVPISFWDAFHRVGLRSHYVASVFATPLLIESGGGLIVCISAPGADVREERRIRCRQGGSRQARGGHGGGTPTFQRRLRLALAGFHQDRGRPAQPDVYPDLSATVPPVFPGRAVAALAADPHVMEKSGQRLKARELAAEYGFTDIDANMH